MKNILYLFLASTLLGCKERKTEQKAIVQTDENPVEWVVFAGNDINAKHIVLVSGDEEYRSEEALPQLAKILSKHHGFKCTVLFAQNPKNPGIIDANYVENIPGLETLATADLMVIFTRFRALPDAQMKHIDDYLMSGKPVVGIRTATHGFMFKDESTSSYKHYSNGYAGEKTAWTDGFGRLVLGEKWIAHHGHHRHQSTRGIVFEDAKEHPIVQGIEDGAIWGASDVYEVRLPLPDDAKAIIYGEVMNRKGAYDENAVFFGMEPTDDEPATVNNQDKPVNAIKMPIAWTKSYQLPNGKKGKAFASTVGAAKDMLIEGTRRLLVNGALWSLDMPIPEKTNVEIVGEFNPTHFEFRDDSYWVDKQLEITVFK